MEKPRTLIGNVYAKVVQITSYIVWWNLVVVYTLGRLIWARLGVAWNWFYNNVYHPIRYNRESVLQVLLDIVHKVTDLILGPIGPKKDAAKDVKATIEQKEKERREQVEKLQRMRHHIVPATYQQVANEWARLQTSKSAEPSIILTNLFTLTVAALVFSACFAILTPFGARTNLREYRQLKRITHDIKSH